MASAPGRVNLIGEFTDYNDGFVLPMALGFKTWVSAAPNDSDRIVVRSDASGDTAVLEIDSLLLPASKGKWTNYLTGVLAGFLEQGLRPKGFDALIVSDVPIGAGLSSSAALEVSFATLLEAVTGKRLDPGAKALLCQSAEHRFAGVPCGIMDPFIATLGRADHALLLDCRSHEPQWLPFTDPTVTVLIINTNVRHELATSAYAQRRHECRAAAEALGLTSLRDASMQTLEEHADRLDSLLVRRARHVIGETSRTLQAAQCIRKREWNEFGRLLDASHQSLKDDYAVSCAELDAVVAIAHGIGQRGGV
ncbi:MAG: galactokinase, partial [Gammaproteobacteria bacterium]|nr:galactokinase [Gammaproteobacteria bacterium]